LFASLIRDIFPKQTNIPTKTYKAVEDEVRILCNRFNLKDVKAWNIKIIQLYETSLVRHGFMLVGAAGCGKTTIMNVLTEALGNTANHDKIQITKMNPKAITGPQMYGNMTAS
jgi:dynein heavy chain